MASSSQTGVKYVFHQHSLSENFINTDHIHYHKIADGGHLGSFQYDQCWWSEGKLV